MLQQLLHASALIIGNVCLFVDLHAMPYEYYNIMILILLVSV